MVDKRLGRGIHSQQGTRVKGGGRAHVQHGSLLPDIGIRFCYTRLMVKLEGEIINHVINKKNILKGADRRRVFLSSQKIEVP